MVCSLKTILVNGSGVSSLQLQAEAVANGHRSPGFQAVPASGHGCPPILSGWGQDVGTGTLGTVGEGGGAVA